MLRDLEAGQFMRREELSGRQAINLIIMDRHLTSGISFANLLYKQGRMTTFELNLVTRQCAMFSDCRQTAAGIEQFAASEATLIYLDIAPEHGLGRIQQRNRAGEQAITLSYLEQLRYEQHAQFALYKTVHKIPILPETTPQQVLNAVCKIIHAA